MKSFFKWIIIFAVVLIVVVIGALLIAPRFIDTAQFKAPVEHYVSEATGRPVSIGDDIALSLFPWAGISFSDLNIGNDTGFEEKHFLSVNAAGVRVKLLPLLSREVLVDRIIINEPHVSLITDKKGRVNWNFSRETIEEKTTAASGSSTPDELPITSLLVEKIRVTNGFVTITDHRDSTHREISDINLALDNVSFDQPIDVALSAVTDQMPLSIEGQFGPIGDPSKLETIALNVQIQLLDHLNARVTGRLDTINDIPSADLDLNVDEFSLRTLADTLKLDLPPTADPKVLNKLGLTAHIKADAESVKISDSKLVLDDSIINFTLTARGFDKPDLRFNLALDRINADRYLPPAVEDSNGDKTSASPTKTPSQKTDYAPLRTMILNGIVTIGTLVVNNATLDSTQLTITAGNGLLMLDPINVALYQGTVKGSAAMDFKGDRPKTDLELAVDKLQLAPLLKDAGDTDALEGALQARIALSMHGDDAKHIKQSLNGNGDLNISDCVFVGIDLTAIAEDPKKALAGGRESQQKARTEITELTAPFTINNGLVRTTGTSMKSERVHMLATGTIDLTSEKLDLLLEPKLVKRKRRDPSKIKTSVSIPIKVTGTFDKPVYRADMTNFATNKLMDKLGDELGDNTELKKAAEELLKGILGGQ